ncbi:MAG TPA: glycine cleavage T C-terminal barrel domain-containing protein [Gemmatimonadaceae bacterium]|jgi:folate-binding protein YgfZ|nr:glycine cleavage T C-terminal barrel domain-containing protein [Gemmatimonadaceae bacterium]
MSAMSALSGRSPAEGSIAGRPVVLHYGDIATEYAALRAGAMLVNRDARGRMRVDGERAAEMIAGLVTNDVQALTAGSGIYAAALNPRGKIVADVRIFACSDHLVLDVPPRAVEGWQAMVRKYINPRIAKYEDQSASWRQFGIFGARARRVAAMVTGLSADSLGALAPYAHLPLPAIGDSAFVARVPDLDLEGYELIVPADAHDQAWHRAEDAGATRAGLLAFEIARIEAGRPEWGLDMDETTIPQEANFDELHAISYTKGCYVGQEVVARVHFRGHVNRHLRGLLVGQSEPPAHGTALLDASGTQVGDVRSGGLSPRLGGIALAMVRREIAPGTTLRALGQENESSVDVAELPFPL